MQERGFCREKYPMTICLQKFCRNYGRYLKRRARSFSRNSIAGYHSMTGTIIHQRPEQEDTGPASASTISKRIRGNRHEPGVRGDLKRYFRFKEEMFKLWE